MNLGDLENKLSILVQLENKMGWIIEQLKEQSGCMQACLLYLKQKGLKLDLIAAKGRRLDYEELFKGMVIIPGFGDFYGIELTELKRIFMDTLGYTIDNNIYNDVFEILKKKEYAFIPFPEER